VALDQGRGVVVENLLKDGRITDRGFNRVPSCNDVSVGGVGAEEALLGYLMCGGADSKDLQCAGEIDVEVASLRPGGLTFPLADPSPDTETGLRCVRSSFVHTSTGHPNIRAPLHSRPHPSVAVQSTSDIDTVIMTGGSIANDRLR
jgi:hypothetical protein